MKKLYKSAAMLAALAVTLAAGIMIHRLLLKPHVWLSTSSPNKTYTVELTGVKGRGGFIVPSTVRFNVISRGQTIVKNAYAHSGDWMDISFELAYPEHAWVSENVMRFWRNPHLPEEKEKSDTLLISNEAGKALKYLKINAKDMFLVFDMKPNSDLKLTLTHQSWLSWVSCEGEFDDGEPIECGGVNFSHHNKLNEPLQYCVSISEGRVTIESPQVEGFTGSNWDRPNIPKASQCNL